MIPISSVSTGGAQLLSGVERPQAGHSEEAVQGRTPRPDRDEYIPEKVRCDTSQVDREIEALKRRRVELEQRIGAEDDEVKRRELERQLAQVERELEKKDTDAYRRQHAVYSRTP